MCIVFLNLGPPRSFLVAVVLFDDAHGGVREQENCNMFRLHWLQVGGATRAMPRRDRARRKRLARARAARLHRYCFKAAVNQAHSVIAAVAAACSARAASSAASRAVSSTGATAARIAARPALFLTAPWNMRAPSTVVTPGTTVDSVVSVRGGIEYAALVSAPLPGETPSNLDRADPVPKVEESCRPPATVRQARCPATRRAIKLVARIRIHDSRGGP